MRVFSLVLFVCIIGLSDNEVVKAEEENPLFLSEEEIESGGNFAPIDIEDVREEAKELQRKADLLKKAAKKKYDEAEKLMTQAGGIRAEASTKTRALMARAQRSQAMNELFSGLFSSFQQMSGSQGQMGSFMTSITQGLERAQRSKVEAELSYAEEMKAQHESKAEQEASPLEIKANTLEEEGDTLLEAVNKFEALANVRTLLFNAEKLRLKVEEESEEIQALSARIHQTIQEVNSP